MAYGEEGSTCGKGLQIILTRATKGGWVDSLRRRSGPLPGQWEADRQHIGVCLSVAPSQAVTEVTLL